MGCINLGHTVVDVLYHVSIWDHGEWLRDRLLLHLLPRIYSGNLILYFDPSTAETIPWLLTYHSRAAWQRAWISGCMNILLDLWHLAIVMLCTSDSTSVIMCKLCMVCGEAFFIKTETCSHDVSFVHCYWKGSVTLQAIQSLQCSWSHFSRWNHRTVTKFWANNGKETATLLWICVDI